VTTLDNVTDETLAMALLMLSRGRCRPKSKGVDTDEPHRYKLETANAITSMWECSKDHPWHVCKMNWIRDAQALKAAVAKLTPRPRQDE
jgi:hypothetical protein